MLGLHCLFLASGMVNIPGIKYTDTKQDFIHRPNFTFVIIIFVKECGKFCKYVHYNYSYDGYKNRQWVYECSLLKSYITGTFLNSSFVSL